MSAAHYDLRRSGMASVQIRSNMAGSTPPGPGYRKTNSVMPISRYRPTKSWNASTEASGRSAVNPARNERRMVDGSRPSSAAYSSSSAARRAVVRTPS